MFQQRKYKRFNYVPRSLRQSKDDNTIKTQWESVRGESEYRKTRGKSLTLLLVILGMIIAIWFILTHYETP